MELCLLLCDSVSEWVLHDCLCFLHLGHDEEIVRSHLCTLTFIFITAC